VADKGRQGGGGGEGEQQRHNERARDGGKGISNGVHGLIGLLGVARGFMLKGEAKRRRKNSDLQQEGSIIRGLKAEYAYVTHRIMEQAHQWRM
jgi:hypothetical protein